jgi:hypothetical protein
MQVLYHLPLVLFALTDFLIGSAIFDWADLDHNPPIYAPVPVMTGELHHAQPLVEMVSHEFWPGLASNCSPFDIHPLSS